MSIININGKTYDAGDVIIAMFGSIDYEVTQISYKISQAHTANNSLGSNYPTSYSMGKVAMEGQITMRLPSISALEKAAGGNLLRVKPFDINVSYVNDDNEPINDTLRCKFTSQGRDVGGDEDLKFQFDLFVLGISFNNL